MRDLETLTVKELQEVLVNLGMPEDDVLAFRTKAPLVAAIRMQQVKDIKVEGEEVKRVKSIEEKPKPAEERQVNKRHLQKAKAMKHRLLGQTTVSILIPTEAGEQKGIVVWASSKTGDKMSFDVWDKLTLDEKMETHQIHVSGGLDSVQLNGYKYFIPKGQYTPVPQQVAEVISRSQQQTLDAGSEVRLDRIDQKTGRPINEVL